MQDFEFRTVGNIHVARGASARLGQVLAAEFAERRCMIVTDKGLIDLDLLTPALASLEAEGFSVTVFDAVVADPPEAVVMQALSQARKHEADIIVGFGGGSSMDVAKLIALLCGHDVPLSGIYGVGQVGQAKRRALVQIPTTAGTGSEVTPISIVTTGETTKMGVVDPILYADMAILDAELTMGLPRAVTAATGIDAMVHAIEAITSKIKRNPVSQALALEALRLLSSNIETACHEPGNAGARQAMLLGALLAGQAFANAPVGAVHALAYPLGGIFHIAHGLSNSLVLPHVVRFNMENARADYALIGRTIASDAPRDDIGAATAMIRRLEEIANNTGIERRLTQLGINHNDVPRLAEDAMKQTRLLQNNPREVTYNDAVTLYEAAL